MCVISASLLSADLPSLQMSLPGSQQTLPMAAHPSLAHRLADPEHLAFSPSNFSPTTISNFTNSESLGVPLHTAWTFWIHK